MKIQLALLISLFAFSNETLAQNMFTADEITTHQKNIAQVTSTASSCLERVYADHVDFYGKWQISKYYGDRNPMLASLPLREAQLRAYGKPVSLATELEPISCIGLTVKCLGEGFKAAGQENTWKKIMAKLRIDNKMYGTDLQVMLRDLGWKTIYWNPNPANNAQWDTEDRTLNPVKPGKKWNPVWGGHAYNYRMVQQKSTYYGIPVDDKTTLVGFQTTVPAEFTASPFFVGVAHAGYHVFPGRFGKVIEAHSMRKLNAADNLEVSAFNPLGTNGGPRWTKSEKYRSGIIAVPPTPL